MPIQIKFVKTADTTNVIQMKKGVNPPGDPFNKPVILDPVIIVPIGSGGSLSFPGTSSGYLTVANFAGLQLGTGNFTIEFFLFQTGSILYPRVFSMGAFPNATIGVSIEGGTFYFWIGGGARDFGSVNLFNAWNHVAIVRSGTTVSVYINGTALATTFTSAYNFNDTTNVLRIGADGNNPAANTSLSGRITNFRWVKGTAVYTANFTRPSAPLTAISGTELLLLVSSADTFLVDSSPNNRTVTNNGNNVTYNVSSPF
jgi:hypothetical protein